MNPLFTMSLAEMHRQTLLAEADAARLARRSGRRHPGRIREAMRRLTAVVAVRAHVRHAAGH